MEESHSPSFSYWPPRQMILPRRLRVHLIFNCRGLTTCFCFLVQTEMTASRYLLVAFCLLLGSALVFGDEDKGFIHDSSGSFGELSRVCGGDNC